MKCVKVEKVTWFSYDITRTLSSIYTQKIHFIKNKKNYNYRLNQISKHLTTSKHDKKIPSKLQKKPVISFLKNHQNFILLPCKKCKVMWALYQTWFHGHLSSLLWPHSLIS